MLQGRLEVAAAIDAKTMRGSREGTGKSAELVTAVEHSTGVVLDAVMTGGARGTSSRRAGSSRRSFSRSARKSLL